jgi:hypothetical protein
MFDWDFFLYEILARIVAAFFFVDCSRTLWRACVERKIKIYSSDFVGWILESFLDDSIRIVHRDTAPIRYWIQIVVQITLVLGCLGVAILGWFHPNT